jgi:Big-like domain-containing protein
LEQVDVTGLMGRGLRLELVAGLGLALALPAMAVESPRGVATETTVTAETHDLNGHTQATLALRVTGQDGQPAHGAVVIADQGKSLAGVALDAEGHATTVLTLTPGDHALTAEYAGDPTHQSSRSQLTPVRAVTGTTPDFSIAVAPATISLKQGQSGAVTASVTPVNASSLTAPMFVTLSCSGLPDQASCTFTPENIEILPNATAAVTSSMDLATAAQGVRNQVPPMIGRTSHPVAWAILLPGALSLAGLAFGAKRRRWLMRISLMSLVGVFAILGTTACNPLYYYKNHGPSSNLPTPAGTYTLSVTAQSSNGITAITHSTTMVLTVK